MAAMQRVEDRRLEAGHGFVKRSPQRPSVAWFSLFPSSNAGRGVAESSRVESHHVVARHAVLDGGVRYR